jgi:hypothetical protein
LAVKVRPPAKTARKLVAPMPHVNCQIRLFFVASQKLADSMTGA